MKTFTNQEKKALRLLQGDMPVIGRPFDALARSCGLEETDVLLLLKKLFSNGILRKFGAVLRHQKAGYRKNALVMWHVSPDAVEKAGQAFASLPHISHCYERSPAFQNQYNLFTMLHGKEDDLTSLITRMAEQIHCRDFLVMESLQEYKKTSPEYF